MNMATTTEVIREGDEREKALRAFENAIDDKGILKTLMGLDTSYSAQNRRAQDAAECSEKLPCGNVTVRHIKGAVERLNETYLLNKNLQGSFSIQEIADIKTLIRAATQQQEVSDERFEIICQMACIHTTDRFRQWLETNGFKIVGGP